MPSYAQQGDASASPHPTFVVYHSEADGVTVVHVDTIGMQENAKGPVIRVYLNDQPIFENPRYPNPEVATGGVS